MVPDTYPFNVLRTAQALYLLAEFAHIGPAEAREISRFLARWADQADTTPPVQPGRPDAAAPEGGE